MRLTDKELQEVLARAEELDRVAADRAVPRSDLAALIGAAEKVGFRAERSSRRWLSGSTWPQRRRPRDPSSRFPAQPGRLRSGVSLNGCRLPPSPRRVIMRCHCVLFGGLLLLGAVPLPAQVLRVADLNTRQIASLDRARTVVVLQGGMLEEHGPYLPAFTDGILSARLTDALTAGIAHQLPGWTVLRFPVISVGASGSNEIGGHFSFPGTYTVRPSILRAMFMDLASELGEQGFRWILVVHVHGSPLHIEAIDDAGDYFHATYGGTMVNLWGLLPVLAGWGSVLGTLPDSVKREDGVSLHAGLDEHSMMLYLDSSLVDPAFRSAPTVAGANYDSSFAVARRPGWPGYLGAPRLATATLGQAIWTGFSTATVRTAVEVLQGTDPSNYPRYMTYLRKSPLYQQWIAEAERRDSAAAARQRSWQTQRSLERAPPRQ